MADPRRVRRGCPKKYTQRRDNDVAHLVRQGQKEVIEEGGGGRNCIILVEIPHSQPQTR